MSFDINHQIKKKLKIKYFWKRLYLLEEPLTPLQNYHIHKLTQAMSSLIWLPQPDQQLPIFWTLFHILMHNIKITGHTRLLHNFAWWTMNNNMTASTITTNTSELHWLPLPTWSLSGVERQLGLGLATSWQSLF